MRYQITELDKVEGGLIDKINIKLNHAIGSTNIYPQLDKIYNKLREDIYVVSVEADNEKFVMVLNINRDWITFNQYRKDIVMDSNERSDLLLRYFLEYNKHILDIS